MDDTELYREQILRHAGPVITGRFLGYHPSYTREVKIGQPLVLAVFVCATVARLPMTPEVVHRAIVQGR